MQKRKKLESRLRAAFSLEKFGLHVFGNFAGFMCVEKKFSSEVAARAGDGAAVLNGYAITSWLLGTWGVAQSYETGMVYLLDQRSTAKKTVAELYRSVSSPDTLLPYVKKQQQRGSSQVRISAIVTAHFGDRDRWPGGGDSGPFRHRDSPFRRS